MMLKLPLASVVPVASVATSAPVVEFTEKMVIVAPFSKPLAAVPAMVMPAAAVSEADADADEVADPGFGLVTVKVTDPAALAVTVAVIEVAVTAVAVAVQLGEQATVAPATKLLPVMVTVDAVPTAKLPLTAVTAGMGLLSVNETVFDVVPPELAVMLTTLFEVVRATAPTAGGVYLPVLSMVPVLALPPLTPLTAQV